MIIVKKNWEQTHASAYIDCIKTLLKLRMVFCHVQLRSFFLQLACCYTSLHNNNNNTQIHYDQIHWYYTNTHQDINWMPMKV